MVKFRMYFDKDKESAWLNEMAAQGLAMKRFFAGFYWFEACNPGEYVYQVDFGKGFGSVSEGYREFMKDTGIEVVQCWGPWVILRKLAAEGEFELYTDVDSSIEQYKKILMMFKVVTILEIICFFSEIGAGITGYFPGYAFAFLMGAFIVTFVNMIARTKKIIYKLQEQKGIAPDGNNGRPISPYLAVGFLFNALSLAITPTDATPIQSGVKVVLQIAAIVFMLAGIFLTLRKREGKDL